MEADACCMVECRAFVKMSKGVGVGLKAYWARVLWFPESAVHGPRIHPCAEYGRCKVGFVRGGYVVHIVQRMLG